jgi:peptide/nickel transport system permease protein
MARFLARRLLRALITLLVFQTILFLLVQAIPWDFVSTTRMPSVYQRVLRHTLGLDLPLWQQYFNYMRGFFTGDLGTSFQSRGTPVFGLFLTRIPRTLLLFLPGTLAGFSLGLWLGKRVGWKRGGRLELGLTLGGVAFYTSFAPWLAFVLINIFALWLKWLPPENMLSAHVWAGVGLYSEQVIWPMLLTFLLDFLAIQLVWKITQRSPRRTWLRLFASLAIVLLTAGLWTSSGRAVFAVDILKHLALPLTTLILLSFGETMLLMRASMLSVLGEDHVLAARAKGLEDGRVRDGHVARLAMLPVLARFIVQLPLVIIGSFVLERIFFWQGAGELLFQAVDYYDLPVILGILSLVGVLMLLAHVFLDVLGALLDPRLRDQLAQAR